MHLNLNTIVSIAEAQQQGRNILQLRNNGLKGSLSLELDLHMTELSILLWAFWTNYQVFRDKLSKLSFLLV